MRNELLSASYGSIRVIFAITLFSVGMAYAQVSEAIKNDDVLKWKRIKFVSNQEQSESVKINIDSATGERIYSSDKTVLLKQSKLFALLQVNNRVLQQDESFNVLPEKLTIGEKWKHTNYSYNDSPGCKKIQYNYDATLNQGPEVVIKIKGQDIKLKTLEIVREGYWYSTVSCGSGTASLRHLFSPELNELVLIESRYYYKGAPSGGTKSTLESIN